MRSKSDDAMNTSSGQLAHAELQLPCVLCFPFRILTDCAADSHCRKVQELMWAGASLRRHRHT
jgi:hypothetical protein